MSKIVVTGGAGYIGSLLTGALLARGHDVRVIDTLMFGGESLLGYFPHPRFAFHKADVSSDDLAHQFRDARAVFHLAAIVGFPACRVVGEAMAYRYNTAATQRVFQACEQAGVERFIFASTYSNYGVMPDGLATEESPLRPQSLYAMTKVAAEQALLSRGRSSRCAPVLPRFATLFGISPRTRFDLLVNQFVLEAVRDGRLVLFQGDYSRSFVHIRDVVDALLLMMEAPVERVRNQIFNVGAETGNCSKHELVALITKHITGVAVEEREVSFAEDMRDIRVSFEKIRQTLGFRPRRSVEDGILEVAEALESGLIPDPAAVRYRNHPAILARPVDRPEAIRGACAT